MSKIEIPRMPIPECPYCKSNNIRIAGLLALVCQDCNYGDESKKFFQE